MSGLPTSIPVHHLRVWCSKKPWNVLLLPFFGTRLPPPPFRSAVVACPPRSFPGSQARLTASWDKLLCMSSNTTAIVNIGFQLGSRTFYTVLYQTTDHLTGLLRIPHWGREAEPKNRLPGQSNGLASDKGGLRHWKALEPNKCRHKGDRDGTESSILKIAETPMRLHIKMGLERIGIAPELHFEQSPRVRMA